MTFFQDRSGGLHCLDDIGYQHLLPPGCTRITDEEAAALQASLNQPGGEAATIRQQIAELESQQTDRRIREAALGIDGGWLARLNDQIEALRNQLKTI